MAKSTRLIPENTFVADSLEGRANALPDGSAREAVILREAAAIYRGFTNCRMVYVQDVQEDVNQVAARTIREATERY